MKIELLVAREIQYFELKTFSFNSYVYYLTRGFSDSTCAFNLLTRAFNLVTRAFSFLTRAFKLVTREFELITRRFELIAREFELVTRGFELITRGFELVTRVLLFHIVGVIYEFAMVSGVYILLSPQEEEVHYSS